MSKMATSTILAIAFLGPLSGSVTATVSYGAVNHVTRQYTWLDGGDLYTPLCWRSVGERQTERLGEYGRELGHSCTYFPYLIEAVLVFAILAGTSLLLFLAIRVRREKSESASRRPR